MKLNNHGWSLNQMIFYCGILLFFLLIAVFFIFQLSNNLVNKDKKNSPHNNTITYNDVEENVMKATKSYLDKYYKEEITTGAITINTDNLKKYSMIDDDHLRPTKENKSCKGYALVKKENGEILILPYIKCSDYETMGYQAWRLGE